ncbi:protein YgfX [Uliginosibacterium sp. 31-12]|uniref:protein YgfX n=1 Tax=Uliginosibacterium sp. 31-12 TaxID=3062781 RepID=UPI0026E27F93|nr:protein YgfX [Uliginosibacterium sp. 31-12]MDO6388266.1 hypothetical protein [Uliginosibacterium sp. 31-12]
MSAPFFLPLRRALLLRVATVVSHVLPLLCVLAPEVPRTLALGVALGVALSALWQLRSQRRLASCTLEVGADACWWSDGNLRLQVDVLADSRDLGWLIVLVWRELESGRCERAALTRDGLAAEDWRALRSYLRWRPKDVQPS